jgi:hypothetical protein
MRNDIDNRVEHLVRECVGRIRGRFLYEPEEALSAVDTAVKKLRAEFAKPKRRGGYIKTSELSSNEPWKPGDPKPERV